MTLYLGRSGIALTSFSWSAEVMNKEHEAAATAASQLTEQLAVQHLAAKQALKQVSCTEAADCFTLLVDVAKLSGPPSTSSHRILAEANDTTSACKRHAGTLPTLQTTAVVAISENKVHVTIGYRILNANGVF